MTRERTNAARRYHELLTELLRRRAQAGGCLPDEEEDRFIDLLDPLWYAMTDEEHAELDGVFAGAAAPSPSGDTK